MLVQTVLLRKRSGTNFARKRFGMYTSMLLEVFLSCKPFVAEITSKTCFVFTPMNVKHLGAQESFTTAFAMKSVFFQLVFQETRTTTECNTTRFTAYFLCFSSFLFLSHNFPANQLTSLLRTVRKMFHQNKRLQWKEAS